MTWSSQESLVPDDLFAPKVALSGANTRLFAGRSSDVRAVAEALMVPGAAGVIYGDRGVGKSSFAWQLFSLFQKEFNLSKRYQFDDYKKAICLWVQAGERFSNIEDILLELLDEPKDWKDITLRSAFPDVFDSSIIENIEATLKLNFGLAQLGIGPSSSKKSREKVLGALDEALREKSINPLNLFLKILNRAKKQISPTDVFIFIDEFDRLDDKSGISELIKNCGNAKFIVVGIADTVDDLVAGHKSIERKLSGTAIEVPPLRSDEIAEIFRIAERIVDHHDAYKSLNFSEEFVSRAVQDSGGFPAIAQHIGYQALAKCDLLGRAAREDVVAADFEYDVACKSILDPTSRSGPPALNQRLRGVLKGSQRKSRILEALSEHSGGWVSIEDLTARIEGNYVLNLFNNLDELKDREIIQINADRQAIKFETPLTRFIIRIAAREGLIYALREE